MHSRILGQLVRFGMVGVAGFVVDAGVLSLLVGLFDVDLYLGRVVSFLSAATTTWFLNRKFTFRDSRDDRRGAEWVRFVSVNAFGGIVNYGTYAALVATQPLFSTYPVLAVAAGSLAGLVFNFAGSRTLVFNATENSSAR
jgi:putative flippase GtrA